MSLRNLADYFLLTDDNWLADYFYEKCLNLCLKQYASLGPQVLAEAQCNLGLAYERRGKLSLTLEKDSNVYISIHSKDARTTEAAAAAALEQKSLHNFFNKMICICVQFRQSFDQIANDLTAKSDRIRGKLEFLPCHFTKLLSEYCGFCCVVLFGCCLTFVLFNTFYKSYCNLVSLWLWISSLL